MPDSLQKRSRARRRTRIVLIPRMRVGLKVASMTIYKVYAAHGVTWYGTKRTYVGSTRSLKARSHFHRLRSTQPVWMRCWTDGEPRYEILKASVYPKHQALLYEALLAAQAIAADPEPLIAPCVSAKKLRYPRQRNALIHCSP